MMNWINCISAKRTGKATQPTSIRSDYQRDYDRLIFSSAFRRLQNKTQVFPLPGSSSFVHNRLTHSLEVASVGRSLGSIIGEKLAGKVSDKNQDAAHFYSHNLKGVIGAACLAHDVGNPAFGHSGEKAISNYFIENHTSTVNDGASLKSYFTEAEWSDLTNFEGNANALRLLTHKFEGKMAGGIGLTYTTLASILKYPCASVSVSKSQVHTKKYGYFQSEKNVFEAIANDTNMSLESSDPLVYKRHPFVYLVEAADDICYRIVDLEDAHRIKILSRDQIEYELLALISEVNHNADNIDKIKGTLLQIKDNNEAVAYLRAKSINSMVMECAYIFSERMNEIINGSYTSTLVDEIEDRCQSLHQIKKLSIARIYNHHSVIKVELAGYKVMSGLLEIFIPAILSTKPSAIQSGSLQLIPNQFLYQTDNPYERVMGVIDFVSGMTDDYAMELYRNIMGISIPPHTA